MVAGDETVVTSSGTTVEETTGAGSETAGSVAEGVEEVLEEDVVSGSTTITSVDGGRASGVGSAASVTGGAVASDEGTDSVEGTSSGITIAA